MRGRVPTQLSAASPGELLAVIRRNGGMTRQELLDHTGMSRSTLYGRLDQLQQAGLVYESSQRDSTGGRPAMVISYDDRDRVILTMDIGHHRATVSLCPTSGLPIAEEVLVREGEPDVAALLTLLVQAGERLLAAHPEQNLIGVGVAIPAPVNRHTGTRLASVAMPDESFPLVAMLEKSFRVPVAIENDARAIAIGASTEVDPLDADDVLMGVKFSTGVGIGLLTGNYIMRGSAGAAGDIGHLQITPGEGPECTCGRRGCLAAYAAGRAIVRDLARDDVADVSALAELYDAGDEEVVAAVEEAATLLGHHIGGFVQLTDPQYVTFGGLLGMREPIAAKIQDSIREAVSGRIAEKARYRVVDGDHTAAAGLVALVLDMVLAPESVNASLED